ncbi:VENN motif pre-toxin domain-containing protein [Sodalis sp. RH15]|uniref:VENN motif pre-toxin domain-containing protein n=1 Tax=Sodalis sp. RH15 TaxID=3394330 RepID=UPI0039B684D1
MHMQNAGNDNIRCFPFLLFKMGSRFKLTKAAFSPGSPIVRKQVKDIIPSEADRQEARDALAKGKNPNETPTDKQIKDYIRAVAYNQALSGSGFGTGGGNLKALTAAVAAAQGLAGVNPGQALAGLAAPYVATEIKDRFDTDTARITAHAVAGAMLSHLQGHSALAGGAGALSAEVAAKGITHYLYPGIEPGQLTEKQKETVSAWSSMVGGLAGGLTGTGGGDVVDGAQAGKNAVENNSLSLPKGMESIIDAQGSLYVNTNLTDEMCNVLNPMPEEEKAAASQRMAAGDLPAEQPATALLTQWGNMLSGVVTMGPGAAVGTAAVVTGGVIGGVAQSSVQLATKGDKPFSYTDALIAIGTGAVTQGRGIMAQEAINIGGAYLGSSIKDESPVGPMVGAGFGTLVGAGTNKVVVDKLKPVLAENTGEMIGNVIGSMSAEAADNSMQNTLNERK